MSDHEFQPLKGDPDLLETKAKHYAQIASAIARSVVTLRKVHDVDDMTSEAVDAVREKAKEVADDIDKARDRYAVTADALQVYATKLRTAKDEADTAISHINEKQEAASAAHYASYQAGQKVHSSLAGDDPDAAKTAIDKADTADSTAADADKALEAAHEEWRAARDAKNAAASTAITAIVEVVDGKKNHGLKDGFWDDWGDVLTGIYDVFKTICDWAGVLAIFLSWVPILGQVLIVLAAVGAVLSVIEATVNLINGDGGWGDLLMAVGMGVLTCFGGKIFALIGKNVRGVVAMKAFSKAGGDLKAGKALQGELAVGKRAASRLAQNKLTFRQFFKDPLDLADTGAGFHFTGAGDVVKKSLQESVKKFTPQGFAGDDAWALGSTAKNSIGLFTTGEKALTVVAGYGNAMVNTGILAGGAHVVESQFAPSDK
ncbi:hypothetical protein OSC27_13045 [Microbacterium sp. STN6]|uniref:putative T7SS-secreted protein n=1 Tax=Microbacterium sp. STN6 TaxID=2995588 RepID=UPI00226101E4|nr:hypothetical protein [Microbacterium sp. STN6]MCX7523198.1 hypothetical protein [Microbacterium sp. STN6]